MPVFDRSAYPRRYRLESTWRALLGLFSLALLAAAAGLIAFQHLGPGLKSLPPEVGTVLTIGCAALALFGLKGLVGVATHEVVLTADAIDVRGLWATRSIECTQIAGWRRTHSGLKLVLQAGRSVPLSSRLERDDAFDAWLLRFPDLDLQDRMAARKVVQHDRAWGATPDERLTRAARHATATRVAVFVLSALTMASLLSHRHLDWPLFAVAAVPLLVLLVATLSRRRIRIDVSPHDLRPSLYPLLAVASVVLAARQGMEVEMQQWIEVVLPALAAGAVLGAWAWSAAADGTPGAQRWAALPFVCLYAGALLVMLNVHLDHAPATASEPSVVTFKRWSGERWRTFTLKLDPVTAKGKARQVHVPLTAFNNVSPGETVCVLERSGRLGWAWTEVRPCALSPTDAIRRALALAAYAPERRGPLLQLLIAQRYDELDAHLGRLQQRFEQREIDSVELLAAYRNFYDPNPELDALFDAWIASFPSSYPAYLARGVHRRFQAERLHGAGFEQWVSPRDNVEQVTDQQIADLEHSTRLTAKPLLSFLHMMDAARYRQQREELRRLLDRGLKVDPGSLALTRKYLAMLGNDLPAIAAFVDECEKAGMPDNTLRTLRAIQLTRRAWALQRQKDQDGALALFREAESLKPYAEDMALAQLEAARIHTQRKQFDIALPLLESSAVAAPDNSSVHAHMAHVLWQVGRQKESLIATRQAAELGAVRSQAYLGEQLLKGELMPRDEAEAARWLQRAASGGDQGARTLLRDNPQLRDARSQP
ncbi:DUF4034 domain-containing protein [Piscinibacter sp. HJYY11]|uniref:DUF4034 domain-containing protein n=1 Tax=Piscinibacter sp. HJYY11 TaxID=2801333 RepID=UPI00191CE0D2|nr:DUF4034 domain-containing protein [Piscinibacter sp. HJYY11]MBL0729836.1 DUF4034 domain-containing protein [Piscinibacter sp. HJYY11]